MHVVLVGGDVPTLRIGHQAKTNGLVTIIMASAFVKTVLHTQTICGPLVPSTIFQKKIVAFADEILRWHCLVNPNLSVKTTRLGAATRGTLVLILSSMDIVPTVKSDLVGI
jgi:hypothetical protein